MPDLAAISTLLSSLNAATSMVRGLLSLERALDKAELKGKLVDVLDSLAEARVTGRAELVRENHGWKWHGDEPPS